MSNDQQNQNQPRMQLMALYEKKTQSGKMYLAGNLGGLRVSIFPNGYKTKDNQPDWIAYISPQAPKNGQGRGGQGGQGSNGGGDYGSGGHGDFPPDFGGGGGDDDHIPF